MRFHDQVVIVTGAASGIGAALARALWREGASVVLAARRTENLVRLAAECPDPARALAQPTDVSRQADLMRLVEATIKHFGRLDGVINNAGVICGGALDDFSAAEAEHVIRVNLLAPVWLTQMAVEHVRKSGNGFFVNVCSLAALVPLPYQAPYCASKAGMRAFTASLRRELAGTRIRVCLAIPGMVDTEMSSGVREQLSALFDLNKTMMTSDHVAAAILNALTRGETEVLIARGPDRVLPILERLVPGLVDRKLRSLAPSVRKLGLESNRIFRTRNASSTEGRG